MLMTLLASLGGLVGSAIPEVINYFQTKEERKHEYKMRELDLVHLTKESELQRKLIDAKALADEGKHLLDHDATLDGGKYINALRASVRPVITYLFFLVFVFVKMISLYHGIQTMEMSQLETHLVLIEILPIIWDENTSALFAATMGFWFGGRQIEKLRGKRNDTGKKRRP